MRLNLIIREKQIKTTILGLFFAILLHYIGNFPSFVENWYALGFYPLFANLLRSMVGWLPFSVGDLVYLLLGYWVLVQLIKGLLKLYHQGFSLDLSLQFAGTFIRFFCWGYILFQLFWGLNYSRLGIANQLDISKKGYSKEDVTALTRALIDKTNNYRKALKDSNLPQMPLQAIFQEAVHNYENITLVYTFLQYKNPAVKISLFTPIADYIGYSGYYAPLTGEAQLRDDLPRILIPYITCHEIAHQLGYASESEANFVGYLAASSSNNHYFNYSVYLDLLGYALGEEFLQYAKDSSNFKIYETVVQYNRSHIDSLVKKDRKEIRQFFLKRRNSFSPVSASLYNQFLMFNKQIAGMSSYDEVIGWLIAYQKKYGKL